MTRSSSTHTTPEPKRAQPTAASTGFDKPDAEQAAEGAPAHEQSGNARDRSASSKHHDDAQHGYSQDSGYQGSGGNGNEAPARKRGSTEVSDESRTPFDQDASKLPGK